MLLHSQHRSLLYISHASNLIFNMCLFFSLAFYSSSFNFTPFHEVVGGETQLSGTKITTRDKWHHGNKRKCPESIQQSCWRSPLLAAEHQTFLTKMIFLLWCNISKCAPKWDNSLLATDARRLRGWAGPQNPPRVGVSLNRSFHLDVIDHLIRGVSTDLSAKPDQTGWKFHTSRPNLALDCHRKHSLKMWPSGKQSWETVEPKEREGPTVSGSGLNRNQSVFLLEPSQWGTFVLSLCSSSPSAWALGSLDLCTWWLSYLPQKRKKPVF